jgi:3-hydroxymyristoyl/3-hydroxydecanoyl-(acyl carrier protein) dehydratase
VEAGQADLFLSGFLGVDLHTRGLACYRLLDAVVTFHAPLPAVGKTIHYDIHVDSFFRQGATILFRFRFIGSVDGQPLLTMTDGCAGFFTADELAAGKGIVHTELDRRPIPGKSSAERTTFVPLVSEAIPKARIDALRAGDLVTAFGPAFASLPIQTPVTLPGDMLKLLDRVTSIEPTGGRFGLGRIRAEMDIHPDDWFITCHFVDDQVMPGTLMYECCLHTLRVMLLRMGWIGEAGQTHTEPVPGVASRLKCRGQVLGTTQVVTYEVTIKEIGYRPEPYVIGDALMYADGKPIVEIGNLSLQMPGLSFEQLSKTWAGKPQKRRPLFDTDRITAYAIGKPSEGFGEPYKIFDRDRIIARLPGPPYQFLDRITQIDPSNQPFVLKAGGPITAEYDVPADAWYFASNRCSWMPFSVLLEVALQPCGWLAAYLGSALTSPVDLSFRNLGGTGVQHRPVTPQTGTLETTVAMTRVSQSAGMIIQHFSLHVQDKNGPVYTGDTYFGFFTKSALRDQKGLRDPAYLEGLALNSQQSLPKDAPYPDDMLRMVDKIDHRTTMGGPFGQGVMQGSITVDPGAWFFRAHFFQDPVWPGSLGLEAFLQLLKLVATERWGQPGPGGWHALAPRQKHEWIYRGQVLPTDKRVEVQLVPKKFHDAERTVWADGFLSVDGRIIYRMKDFSLTSNRELY